MNKINKVFEDNYTVVAMSCSGGYVPYLSVYLKSIVSNSSVTNNYDIVVFESSISDEDKEKLKSFIQCENISLRFCNPSELLDGIDLYISHSYFAKECYYRLLAPVMFSDYKKVVFTDIDLIVNEDIKKLYDTETNGMPISACIDPMWHNLIDCDVPVNKIIVRSYAKEILSLDDIYKYYNTGIVIYDIEACKKIDFTKNILELINKEKFLFQEQCAINKLLRNQINTLDSRWNYEIDRFVNYPESTEPYIYHFLSINKPWFYTNAYKANIWWEYARQTPYYERILSMLMDNKIKEFSNRMTFFQYILVVLNYWKCKLFVNFVSGKNKKYYVHEKYRLKDQIKAYKDR